jgi:hypothetical protein
LHRLAVSNPYLSRCFTMGSTGCNINAG